MTKLVLLAEPTQYCSYASKGCCGAPYDSRFAKVRFVGESLSNNRSMHMVTKRRHLCDIHAVQFARRARLQQVVEGDKLVPIETVFPKIWWITWGRR